VNKQGSKADAEIAPPMLEHIDFDDEAECEACKL
jgi:hypothetical protein